MENHLLEAIKPDYATPALYFFSTVAQTMGAIIAIVLTGVFAIIPQIQQKHNTPNTRLLIRFMKKDYAFTNAVSLGFTSICVSIISLLIMYIYGLSQIMSITLLIVVGIPVLFFGIYSCYNIWIFVSNNVSRYNNLLYLYEPFTTGKRFDTLNKLLNDKNILDYSELFVLIDTELPNQMTLNSKCAFVISALDNQTNKNTTLELVINDIYQNLLYSKDYLCPNNENYYVNIFNSLFMLYQGLRESRIRKSNAHLLSIFHNILEKCQSCNPIVINRAIISKYYNFKTFIIDCIQQDGLYVYLFKFLSELVLYFDYNNYHKGIDITNVLSQINYYINMDQLNAKEKSNIFNCCSLIMIYVALSNIRLVNENKHYDKNQLLIALNYISRNKNTITDNLFNFFYYKYQKEQIILNYLSGKEFPKPTYRLHQSQDKHGIIEINYEDYEVAIKFINNDTLIQSLFNKPITTASISHDLSNDVNWRNVKHFSKRHSLFAIGL